MVLLNNKTQFHVDSVSTKVPQEYKLKSKVIITNERLSSRVAKGPSVQARQSFLNCYPLRNNFEGEIILIKFVVQLQE